MKCFSKIITFLEWNWWISVLKYTTFWFICWDETGRRINSCEVKQTRIIRSSIIHEIQCLYFFASLCYLLCRLQPSITLQASESSLFNINNIQRVSSEHDIWINIFKWNHFLSSDWRKCRLDLFTNAVDDVVVIITKHDNIVSDCLHSSYLSLTSDSLVSLLMLMLLEVDQECSILSTWHHSDNNRFHDFMMQFSPWSCVSGSPCYPGPGCSCWRHISGSRWWRRGWWRRWRRHCRQSARTWEHSQQRPPH